MFCDGDVRGNCARELSLAWEIERLAGGANKVTGPKEYSSRIAHIQCQERHRKGREGQGTLL